MPRPASATRGWLLAMAALCVAAVAAALVSQYVFDMQPCPWCILQRLVFVGVGVLCLVAGLFAAPAARKTVTALALLLAALGASAAVWQHVVAAKSASCNLTLADRIMSASQLDRLLPDVFEARASCADAAVNLLGVPYAMWSALAFVVCAIVLIGVLRRSA